MNGDLHLDSLMRALRTAGLRVGISEVLRLQQVFARQPSLTGGEVPRERLRSLLRAVLVKSAEDRGIFDRICDAWIDRTEEDLELRRATRRPVPAPPPEQKGFRRRSLLRQAAKAAALALLLFIMDKDTRVQKRVIAQPSASETPAEIPRRSEGEAAVTPADVRKRTFRTSVATLEVTADRWSPLLRPEMGLAAFAWLGAGGLWLALRRRRLLPEPEPAAPTAGPPRAFPLPVAPAGAVLLAPRDQEGLAWGIDRFVAEEPTRRLDLPATVRAMALAGGLPEMRFHRARFYREVWLWVDEDAEDPALSRLADEIEAVLAAHGLPVERAAFRGVPHRLVTAAGQVFAPNEIDERRDAALVAVLTDGRRLVRRWAADDQRVCIDALLRSLSHWPHLAFVDASREGDDLAVILGRHGLAVIAPERAAAFLGGAPPQRAALRPAGGPDWGVGAAWAAVCALCPAPVDEVTALELRRRLGLAASPYSLQALRAEAPGPPGRLAWRAADRIRRVSWLREAEIHPDGAVMPGSLLSRALDFWDGIYDRSLAEPAERTGEGPHTEAPAERFLRMERALLGLWRKPGDHVSELYRLYQGPLREVIVQHCETLASSDLGGPNLIHLPWPWSKPTPVERAMLREMHFGGGMPPAGLRRPGRAWLGIGLLAGLGLAAAGMAVFPGWSGRQPEIVVVGEPPAGAATAVAAAGGGLWRVTVATRKWDVSEEVEDGSRVLVRWQPRQLPCVESEPRREEWRCGSSAAPAPRLPGVARSVVLLDRTLSSASAERLALDLLDSGSADIVVVGSPVDLLYLTKIKDQQILLLSGASRWSAPVLANSIWFQVPAERAAWLMADRLAEDLLRFEGMRRVREIWPDFLVFRGDPSRVLLRGLGTGCRNEEIEEGGFVFVRICSGTFTMGSEDIDPGAYIFEMPAHRVTLDEFWMSKYEVTNAQYQKLHRGHTEEPNLPVTGVSWFDARDFCEKFGYRLPTEAEWEYAAQASMTLPWLFGGDERVLGRFAWFEKNAGNEPHPVGWKEPNPWGLHDLHGNVWEWVGDWYGPYSAKSQMNPTGPPKGTNRVLRGGSYVERARSLRSAFRVRNRPEDRHRTIGFRCVRGPRRQL